jgi:unsaturated rhamnogalacturonyl hydrolase
LPAQKILKPTTLWASPAERDPASLGSQVLARVLAQDPALLGWDWGSGLLGHSLLRWPQEADRKKNLGFLRRWVDGHLEQQTPIADTGGLLWKLGVGTTVLHLQASRPSPRYTTRIQEMLDYVSDAPRFGDGLIASKRERPEVWVDSLMTLCPFLARAEADGFSADGWRSAMEQILLHAKALQDPSSGLWVHACNVKTGKKLGHLWSRGNGWAIFGMVETLEGAPDAPEAAAVRQVLRQTVEGLLAAQSNDGGWHTLLDRTETFVETSGQAMLIHGLAKSARLQMLPARLGRQAHQAACRGWLPLSTHVSDTGEITGTSIGTAALDLRHYATRPTASWPVWGSAAVLLAAGELAHPHPSPCGAPVASVAVSEETSG